MNKQKIVIPLGIGWHIPASWTMVDCLMKTKQTSGPQIIKTTVLNSNCGFDNLRTASLFSFHWYDPSILRRVYIACQIKFLWRYSLKYIVKTTLLFLVNDFSNR